MDDDELKKYREKLELLKARQKAEREKEEGAKAQPAAAEGESGADRPVLENSIFVGGLHTNTNRDKLQDAFSSCGAIKKCTLKLDPRTYHSRGFGYIEFMEPAAVELALKLNGMMIDGREVKVSRKRDNQPGLGRGGHTSRGRRGRRGRR